MSKNLLNDYIENGYDGDSVPIKKKGTGSKCKSSYKYTFIKDRSKSASYGRKNKNSLGRENVYD